MTGVEEEIAAPWEERPGFAMTVEEGIVTILVDCLIFHLNGDRISY